MTLFIILEHKSWKDRLAIAQIADYCIQVNAQNIREALAAKKLNSNWLLPPPIGIIFYHGNKKFDKPTELKDLYLPVPGIVDYVPHMKAMMFDLSQISYGNLPRSREVPELEVGLMLLKAVFDPEVDSVIEKALELMSPYLHLKAYQNFVKVAKDYISWNASHLSNRMFETLTNKYNPVDNRGCSLDFTLSGACWDV